MEQGEPKVGNLGNVSSSGMVTEENVFRLNVPVDYVTVVQSAEPQANVATLSLRVSKSTPISSRKSIIVPYLACLRTRKGQWNMEVLIDS